MAAWARLGMSVTTHFTRILKTRALYLTSVEKVLGQYLHLLKIENCRL